MRRLPVYFLIDVSDSMVGEPIHEVRKGLEGITADLRNDPYALETVFVSVLAFAGKAECLAPLTELILFVPPALPIGSGTNLGAGLDLLMASIDREVLKNSAQKKGDWKPIIFLFTDGTPTSDPGGAIARWNAGYRKGCNLVAITFGENADVALLESLTDQVLTLTDTSSQSFREFFKWITASLKVSSMAVAENGDDKGRLANPGINLEKANAARRVDENYVILPVRCSQTGNLWLAKYGPKAVASQSGWGLIGTYVIDGEAYERLGDESHAAAIDSSSLFEIPVCPCCEQGGGMIVCGACGKISCLSSTEMARCPWCGNEGEITLGGNFDISRSRG